MNLIGAYSARPVEPPPRGGLDRLARGAALVTGGIAASALAGWAAGWPFLTHLGERFVAMAPRTGLAFLCLAGALWMVSGPRPSHAGCGWAVAIAALVLGSALCVPWAAAAGADPLLERVPAAPAGPFAAATASRMSPVTAGNLALAALALGALAIVPGRRSALQAAAGAVVVSLVMNLGEGVGVVDAEERFVLANPAAELIFGVRPEWLVGRNIAEFLSPAQYAKVLAQSARRLAGGIAHDFNNLLQAMLSLTQTLPSRLAQSAEAKEAVAELARGPADRWPGIRVVLMSSYTEDEAVRLGVRAGEMRFLQKPFDMLTPARELRAALAS